jgi:hypothetical protein
VLTGIKQRYIYPDDHGFAGNLIGKKINKKVLRKWKKAGEKELVRYLSKNDSIRFRVII